MTGPAFRKLLLAFGLAGGIAAGQAHAADTPIKFSLDWKFEGPAAPFLIAAEKGYFKAEGLDVTIDSGNGSAGAVTRVASGAYDIAQADINSMMEFNDKNPDKKMKAAFMIYDVPPFAIFSLKKSNITKPSDLIGKTLGAPVFDSPRKLFPALAKGAGIDASKVTWKTMDPPLREPMLMRGDVDAISGFYFTSLLNLRQQGITESQLNVIHYSQYGVSMYGNALIPSPKLMAEKPEAVKAFFRAVVKGWRDVVADPAAGIAAVKRRDPLISETLELDRLKMAIADNVLTKDVMANGFGGVRADKLATSIEQVAAAFNLATKPIASEVFTDAFLPAKADRMLSK